MYEGVAEQLHQFIVASSTATASSLPAGAVVLPFTTFPNNNISPNTTFHHHHHHDPTTILTNYPSSSLLQHHHHHQHSLLTSTQHQEIRREVDEDNTTISNNKNNNLVMMDDKNSSNWSNDEVLALLKIRSSLENWFLDFTNWDQVSRKMGEQGFKRSAEKCKEKYEEESRFFNLNTSTTTTTTNNSSKYMFVSELEELFHGGNDDHNIENDQQVDDATNKDNVQNPIEEEVLVEEMQDREQSVAVHEVAKKSQRSSKKKYNKRKFEMIKCFCESVVRSIMTQQEMLYNKILEDMVKRDNETIAREEAWQKQEIDRFNKEVEIRTNEQAIAYRRQASMNDFFKNFAISQDSQIPKFTVLSQNPNNDPGPSARAPTDKNPDSYTNHNDHPNHHVPNNSPNLKIQNDPSTETPASNSPPCQNPNIGSSNDQEDKDYSKRWPRDEVLALINLRSNFYTTNEEKEGSISNNNNNNKGPLWEKISQGMIELGYKRNAKRCKEKWENINKYFRKTKDSNASKKRSLNSRTCPYFHQLSTLYNQGSTTTP